MATDDAVRWTIKVSKETDLALRSFLGSLGMKKGDLSKFVEEAVRWRVLDRTVEAIRADNDDVSVEELDAQVEQALGEVRTARREQRQLTSRRSR